MSKSILEKQNGALFHRRFLLPLEVRDYSSFLAEILSQSDNMWKNIKRYNKQKKEHHIHSLLPMDFLAGVLVPKYFLIKLEFLPKVLLYAC